MMRRTSVRGAAAAALTAVTLMLAACTGLPASGPVFAGLGPGAVAPPDFTFVPLKPQDGASPQQIVQGFIDAGIGPENNWAVAQLYLAPSFRATWKPGASTTIDDRATRVYASTDDADVTLTVTQRATVDGDGAYRPSDGGTSTLSFELAKVEGQWRITKAPDGVVLGTDQFTGVYHEYPVMYFDPGWHYLVPDVRWFPTTNAATRIAKSLVDGKPSPWLAGSVTSAFPEDVSLDPPSVPVSGSAAQVELGGPVLSLDSRTLGRMQTQLDKSLAAAGVTDVTLAYGGTPLNADPASVGSTRIDGRALVRSDKGFGFLSSSGQVDPLTALSDTLSRMKLSAVTVSADYGTAAVRTASGSVLRIGGTAGQQALDDRSGLLAPAIDAQGYVWSVPRAHPSKLTVYGADGTPIHLGGAWSNVSTIQSMSISRDGTRLAALMTVGGQAVVNVFGIERSSDGVPTALGDAVQLTKLPGAGIDLTWLDDAELGILAHTQSGSDSGIVEIQQPVGGPGVSTPAPEKATTISGTSATTVRLRDSSGVLYTQRGSNWEQAATGIDVLATAQGMPR